MPGRLIGGCLKVGIAKAAIAALQQDDALTDFRHIGDQGFIVFFKNLRADGHLQDGIFPVWARPVSSHAMGAGFAFEVLSVAIVDEGVEAVDAFHNHMATAPAIAPVWAAELDILLPPEADRARAAVA